MKKVLAASLLISGMCCSGVATASDITVGGVTWDPDFVLGPEMDFIGRFNFTQWFSAHNDAVGSVDSYSVAVTFQDVLDATPLGPGGVPIGDGSATGLYLSGVGEFNELNGDQATVSDPFGGALDSFCPGCELTYAFGGLGLNNDLTFDLSGAWAQIYVDQTPDFNVPPTDQTEASNALGDLLWLDLEFGALDFISFGAGATSGFVDATLNIVGGAAANNFEPTSLEYNGSAFNAGLDTQFSTGGNGAIEGNSIPEPTSLALIGLGLLGFGAAARRKKA